MRRFQLCNKGNRRAMYYFLTQGDIEENSPPLKFVSLAKGNSNITLQRSTAKYISEGPVDPKANRIARFVVSVSNKIYYSVVDAPEDNANSCRDPRET